MILPIVQTGDPVLRQVARSLTATDISDPKTAALIADMRETMRAAPGVGLAAPQIGLSLSLVVIEDPHAGDAARERKPIPFQVLINPRLTVTAPDPVTHFEGCLSVAPFSMLVPRAQAVHVEALDETGRPITFDATGWYARILQHEIDHLNGMLCIDRMESRSFTTNENFTRHFSGLAVPEVKAALHID